MAKEKATEGAAPEAQVEESDFAALLQKEFKPKSDRAKEEVASAVVFLASDKAGWISGVTLSVDGVQHNDRHTVHVHVHITDAHTRPRSCGCRSHHPWCPGYPGRERPQAAPLQIWRQASEIELMVRTVARGVTFPTVVERQEHVPTSQCRKTRDQPGSEIR